MVGSEKSAAPKKGQWERNYTFSPACEESNWSRPSEGRAASATERIVGLEIVLLRGAGNRLGSPKSRELYTKDSDNKETSGGPEKEAMTKECRD